MSDALRVPDDAPPGTYTYRLVKSGPDVNADEVELLHVQAVEVMVLWGTNVLHVSHLTPPRNFYVGEEQGKNFACDFFIPAERLGTTRMPIVRSRVPQQLGVAGDLDSDPMTAVAFGARIQLNWGLRKIGIYLEAYAENR